MENIELNITGTVTNSRSAELIKAKLTALCLEHDIEYTDKSFDWDK